MTDINTEQAREYATLREKNVCDPDGRTSVDVIRSLANQLDTATAALQAMEKWKTKWLNDSATYQGHLRAQLEACRRERDLLIEKNSILYNRWNEAEQMIVARERLAAAKAAPGDAAGNEIAVAQDQRDQLQAQLIRTNEEAAVTIIALQAGVEDERRKRYLVEERLEMRNVEIDTLHEQVERLMREQREIKEKIMGIRSSVELDALKQALAAPPAAQEEKP